MHSGFGTRCRKENKCVYNFTAETGLQSGFRGIFCLEAG